MTPSKGKYHLDAGYASRSGNPQHLASVKLAVSPSGSAATKGWWVQGVPLICSRRPSSSQLFSFVQSMSAFVQ